MFHVGFFAAIPMTSGKSPSMRLSMSSNAWAISHKASGAKSASQLLYRQSASTCQDSGAQNQLRKYLSEIRVAFSVQTIKFTVFASGRFKLEKTRFEQEKRNLKG